MIETANGVFTYPEFLLIVIMIVIMSWTLGWLFHPAYVAELQRGNGKV